MTFTSLSPQDLLNHFGITPQHSGVSTGENQWYQHPKSKIIISYNPSTGKEIGQIETAHETFYEKFLTQAQQGFTQWRSIPAPQRGLIIREIAEEIRKNKDPLGSLVALEMGKSKSEGDGEVQEMIDMADFAVGQSRMLYGYTMPSERPCHRLMEQWHPLGIIGVITAFNFPVAVWAWNAFLAGIGGNVVIWKPSSKTALCAIAIQHLVNKVMERHHLSGIFNLWIANETSLSEKLIDDRRIPLISFTGSTSTGRHINTRVAQRLGKTLLELGGNNAVIIDETADLNAAIQAVIFGAIGTSGQRCTSIRRLFLQESIAAPFLERLIHAYGQITIGDPLNPQNIMGPLIDSDAVKNYQKALERCQNLGGEILFGGKVLDRPGFFVEPCIVRAENHWDIVQQETFAPILYVMRFQTLVQAIELQNAVPQGLSSAIFTQSMRHMEQFISVTGSDCGIANINTGTSGAEIGGAFGGEKDTGGGREAGSDSWKAYMRRQTTAVNFGYDMPLAQGIHFELPVN
jgi:aldehyde dehydrogenase (NAD+)